MKIYINARFLTQSLTGVQRYAVELVKAFDSLIDEGKIDSKLYSFSLLAPGDVRYELDLKHIPLRRVGILTGHLWEQIELPFHAYGGLLVSLCNAAPLFKLHQVVTIHDAAVFAIPQSYSAAFRTWYKILLPCIGRIGRKIMTVSEFSRKELVRHLNIDEGKVEVIYLGKEHISSIDSDEDVLKRNGIGDKPFILAVSSMSYNKNFQAVVRAIELLGEVNFDIVIAGGTNPKVFGQSEIPLPSIAKYLGYVTDAELKTLYTKASCFVYPSFYEGFGLPPIEAMSCGCPVIASNAASLPEVCGDAALYCDPHSPKDIAGKIRQMMNDETLRKSLQQKGLERVRHFSWERCTRETFEVIEKVLLHENSDHP
jgi:glycosyltransferase involved in cell wall biosynthesis